MRSHKCPDCLKWVQPPNWKDNPELCKCLTVVPKYSRDSSKSIWKQCDLKGYIQEFVNREEAREWKPINIPLPTYEKPARKPFSLKKLLANLIC